jgi:TatD DNase family protein
MLIDTHAHLWFDEYRDDLEQVLARAKEAGVEKMIVPGTDSESNQKAIASKEVSGRVYAA